MYANTLKLKALPARFIQRLKQIRDKKEASEYYIRTDSGNESFKIPDDIQKWLQENIAPAYFFMFNYNRSENPENVKPHIDGLSTHIKMLCVLDAGGEDVTTTYHDETGEVVETYKFIEGSWNLLQVDVPHKVNGLELGKTRTHLACGVTRMYGAPQ